MDFNYIDNLPSNIFHTIKKWDNFPGPFQYSIIGRSKKDDPKWYVSAIKLSNFPVGSLQNFDSNASAGCSIYIEEAIIKSIGEAIERYCLTNYFINDKFTFLEIDKTKNYVRCSEYENSPESYKDNGIKVPIEHTEVIRIYDNKVDYLPCEYIHLGFKRKKEIGEYVSPVSTGCSFFPDKIISIWKGICEVVERDALMRFWYLNFRNAKKVNLDTITNYDLLERLKRIRDYGITPHLFQISNIIDIPVILCVLERDTFPYYCCGCSCDNNVISASIKAIDEAISISTMAKWNGFEKDIDTTSFKWVNKLEDHMQLYANWKNSNIMISLLTQVQEKVEIENIKINPIFKAIKNNEDIKTIALYFKDKGFDIFYKDITLPEVSNIGYVTKVVIPQMIPLSQSHNSRWLQSLINDHDIDFSQINPFPQPFS